MDRERPHRAPKRPRGWSKPYWAQAGLCPTWLLTSADSVTAVCANIDRAGLREWWRSNQRFVVTHPRLAAHPGFAPGARITVCRPGEEEIFNAFVAA